MTLHRPEDPAETARWERDKLPRRLRTQADEHGNLADDCGHCTLLPTLRGYVRATQVDCPEHGGRAVAAAANLPRRLRTQAERDADGTTWRPTGICGNTIPSLLGGDPLVCARTAGHDGSHQDQHGSLWTLPGPSGVVDIHRIVVPQQPPRRRFLADLWWWLCQIIPPRRRWWHLSPGEPDEERTTPPRHALALAQPGRLARTAARQPRLRVGHRCVRPRRLLDRRTRADPRPVPQARARLLPLVPEVHARPGPRPIHPEEPVTQPAYTDTDVALVVRALPVDHEDGTTLVEVVPGDPPRCIWGRPERVARTVLDALAVAGRLLPAGGDLGEQWTARKSSVPDGEGFGLPSNSRDGAVYDRDRWLAHDRGYPVTAELVRRDVRRWPDGSVFVGPWTSEEPA